MDVRLTDLDALSLSVREPRSRAQIREAIAAYRAGAYRAAVTATWVAVAVDILAKIQEVAQQGDGAAREFVARFERARAANNLPQLQQLENDLLKQARETFQFVGTIEADLLRRLVDDRHRCAHPAFIAEDELFQPSGDLVRSHIVHAMTLLLTHPPAQGRTLIEAFARELASPAFPKGREPVRRYVAERYLARMRPNAVPGFARYVLRQILDREDRGRYGIQPREAALLGTLDAIAAERAELWARDLQSDAVRMIDGLDGEQIGRGFLLLAAFPELAHRLDGQQRARLLASLENWKRPHGYDVFAVADVPGFEDAAAQAFERAPTEQHTEIALHYPSRRYLEPCLLMLSRASSYRGAEFTLAARVRPLAARMVAGDVPALLDAIKGNDQAWNASGIPATLTEIADTLRETGQLGPSAPWDDFRQFLGRKRALHFDELWEALAGHGVQTTPAREETEPDAGAEAEP